VLYRGNPAVVADHEGSQNERWFEPTDPAFGRPDRNLSDHNGSTT